MSSIDNHIDEEDRMNGKQDVGNYGIIYMLIIAVIVYNIVATCVIVRYIIKLRHEEKDLL